MTVGKGILRGKNMGFLSGFIIGVIFQRFVTFLFLLIFIGEDDEDNEEFPSSCTKNCIYEYDGK